MAYNFCNQKSDSGVNEVLSWFGINLKVGFHNIAQHMFCDFGKISHQADLEIYYLHLELPNGTMPVFILPLLYIQTLHSSHEFKYPPSCFNLLVTPLKI